ncbi:hypothetical protein PAAG_03475 [Paracoccidioides lutzii Pb01]|uniref:DUF2306 domain-containing protein n=1 Tax=Paracoccidioides lutzii (strain ATCC MYA-826 / Pb01) TaxID=502779 RepID=C1GXA1_PARBA|nr:hypothetical protein PAAG_03475 [Paracoccidioides lutzii Pb01]EEH41189.1 hypothetical protein PAAG_03475 [Paracoccidioides lutzii Pb01]
MSFWRRICDAVGFSKSYNAILFCVFATPFFLFALSEAIQSFTLGGIRVSRTVPGEKYWWQSVRGRLGISLHLGAVLPFALLSVLQFIPAIRRNWPGFHRINGRIAMTLFLISNIGALMIVEHTFGGALDMQFMVLCLATLPMISMVLAYYNIYRLQLEQHRAWILRAMFYAGVILSARPLLVIGSVVISRIGTYQNIWPCEMIDFTWREYGAAAGDYLADYPQCASGSNNATTSFAIVRANIFSDSDPAQIGACFQIPASTSFMLALILHAVGVEIYLALTQGEANRLRIESYRRQRAAGYANPGSAGLVADKFGDFNPWKYPREEN